jgi:hypothetical protein
MRENRLAKEAEGVQFAKKYLRQKYGREFIRALRQNVTEE